MKKIALLFVCICVLSLSACGKTNNVKTTKTSTSTSAVEKKKKTASSKKEKAIDIDWPTSEIGTKIPKPTFGEGNVIYTDEVLRIDLQSVTKKDYTKYYNKVKKDFSHDMETSGSKDESYFIGYNKEGYELELYLDGKEKTMAIALETPKGTDDLIWPSDGLGKQIPKPNSQKGTIKYNTDDEFDADISGISKEAFKKYASELQKTGYTKDLTIDSDFFSGTNSAGINLVIHYSGGNIMNISAYIETEDSSLTEDSFLTQDSAF